LEEIVAALHASLETLSPATVCRAEEDVGDMPLSVRFGTR